MLVRKFAGFQVDPLRLGVEPCITPARSLVPRYDATGRVEVQQVSMFLLKGNTLLTIFLDSSRSYTDPLLEQLRIEGALMRDSSDASFLMYRVVDTIVDHIALISSEYDRILDCHQAKVSASAYFSATCICRS